MHKTHPILYKIKHNFQQPKQNKSLTNYLFVLPDRLTIIVLHTACFFQRVIFTITFCCFWQKMCYLQVIFVSAPCGHRRYNHI